MTFQVGDVVTLVQPAVGSPEEYYWGPALATYLGFPYRVAGVNQPTLSYTLARLVETCTLEPLSGHPYPPSAYSILYNVLGDFLKPLPAIQAASAAAAPTARPWTVASVPMSPGVAGLSKAIKKMRASDLGTVISPWSLMDAVAPAPGAAPAPPPREFDGMCCPADHPEFRGHCGGLRFHRLGCPTKKIQETK